MKSMQKAFIFDLDGVLIDDEPIWEEVKKELFTKLFGEKIYSKIGSTIGINIDGIYEKVTRSGGTIQKEDLTNIFNEHAAKIYQTTPLTPGLEELGDVLPELGFVIGIVSSSPMKWIDTIINRVSFKDDIEFKLSLHDHPDLKRKPAPDGYVEAMNSLGSTPQSTIALEDSNAGIASAVAAGAYTIGLKQNLVKDYVQKNADIYAENMEEVLQIVKNFSR